jgi:UDP-N-acetylmuramate--alanine ligase
MDIYPARELPIEGVTADIIFNKMKNSRKILTSKPELMQQLRGYNWSNNTTLLTLGAGDIDTFVAPIQQLLVEKFG